MALILREFLNFHDYAIQQWGDERVSDWYLMKTAWPIVFIIATYLYFVLSLGPKLMENRKPFNIDKILIVYNAIQVIYCAVLFILGTIYIVPYQNLMCAPVDYSMNPHAIFMTKLVWWYHLLKLIDLLDTIFFVLRKKNNQVSFLHLYHHAGMVVLTWVGGRFLPGGASLYLGYANLIVHIPMYGYYLVSVWDKSFRNNLWFKKQITHLQLIQFGFLVLLFSVMLAQKDCAFPKFICMFMIPQNLFMFALFGDFYRRTYILPQKNAKNAKQHQQ